MELILAWFWLLKLITVLIMVYVSYIAFGKYKFKNNFYNILAGILILLSIVNPIKIVPSTDKVNSLQTAQIEQHKVLPEKVTNNNFKTNTSLIGITAEDLK